MKTKRFFLSFLCLLLITGCSKEEADPHFAIETSGDLLIAAKTDSKATVTFTSTREWQASSSADWIAVSPSSGAAGTFTVTVTARSENTTDNPRSATLILASGSLREKITLQQEAANFIKPEQIEYKIPVKGEALQIAFSTNLDKDEFGIYGSSVNWLTQNTQTRTTSNYVIHLNVLENTEKNARIAAINFVRSADSKVLATVKIIQDGTATSTSTDYTGNKSVRVLQEASVGRGIPIVIMGDGFIDKEIADGTYGRVMDKAFENIFTEEPMRSLRNYFNVYSVTAISKNNEFGDSYETVFGCKLEGGGSTGITGDDKIVEEYTKAVQGINVDETLVVVILNTSVHAGTTFSYYNANGQKGLEFSIAYCPVIINLESEDFRQVLTHEVVGHGFAKLDDEYSYTEKGTMPSEEIAETRMMQAWGWRQNVDFTANPAQVLWASFLNDNRYALEGLGVFEGACTYIKGAYRPSNDSMMNSNRIGFNAPCRKEVYDKVIERGTGVTPTYEEFVLFDLQHKGVRTRSISSDFVRSKPFARPRLVEKNFN